MIGEKEGWVTIPPGTRKSTYANEAYLAAAPFAIPTLKGIESASLVDNTAVEKPYVGINFAIIPEMQAINNYLGQQIAAALTGQLEQLGFEREVDDVRHPVVRFDELGIDGRGGLGGHAHRGRIDNSVDSSGIEFGAIAGDDALCFEKRGELVRQLL